ncbi:MAG TPA: hypothetical protein VGQ99_16665 [Tepidisphaeraceae bacterium]|jgi:hypothetical protein|nr:hypothetical protein [Tepidisphaeraceae bacterium]
MIVLFLGLTLANLACLIATAILGYAGMSGGVGSWHRLAGALSAIVCCGVHCVVFTYFIATGKWIAHAIMVKQLDPGIANPTRSFKAAAFPAALGAITLAIATAVVGAAVDNQYLGPVWHHIMAVLLIAGNLGAAAVEYRAIRGNGLLIDEIIARINATSR